jgi:phosphohistidine swiveling domain-containing protein
MTIETDPTGPLHSVSGPDTFWSTTNVGEALPGVATPLGWSLWGPAVELGVRDCFARMGALPRDEVRIPAGVDDRLTSVFYGRAALNVNFFCEMGGRLPGTGPDAIARNLLGEVPAGIPLENTMSRMPSVAVRMPHALITIRKDVIARTAPVKGWWQGWVPRLGGLDERGARAGLAEARDQFTEMIRVQAGGVFIAVQSVYDQLLALIEKAGLDPAQANALVAGQGSHAETDIIFDLWRMGRKELSLDRFLTLHGYHGPLEGEVSGRVWREDSTPVERLAAQYAERTDDQNPAIAAAERTTARIEAEKALLAGLPRLQQPGAKLVLKLAVSRIPLRGVAKAAYLQSLDVARGTARRLGALYAEDGTLEDAEDVFLFEVGDLVDGLPANAKELAADRRAQRAEFLRHDIASHWGGEPLPFEITPSGTGSQQPSDVSAGKGAAVSGIGASGGVVEGAVRIVHDPTFTDIEPDEVLVCVTTDPSWASVLFLSSALVVDIGGLLSHAAVVAREVGVPCVIGTVDGTKVLRTGDRVRVDGNAGTVTVLERAADDDAPAAPKEQTA